MAELIKTCSTNSPKHWSDHTHTNTHTHTHRTRDMFPLLCCTSFWNFCKNKMGRVPSIFANIFKKKCPKHIINASWRFVVASINASTLIPVCTLWGLLVQHPHSCFYSLVLGLLGGVGKEVVTYCNARNLSALLHFSSLDMLTFPPREA